jgi:hypothetical protein
MKQGLPSKARAEVRASGNRWIVMKQYPGSTLIISADFGAEDEAVRHANEFLAAFRG